MAHTICLDFQGGFGSYLRRRDSTTPSRAKALSNSQSPAIMVNFNIAFSINDSPINIVTTPDALYEDSPVGEEEADEAVIMDWDEDASDELGSLLENESGEEDEGEAKEIQLADYLLDVLAECSGSMSENLRAQTYWLLDYLEKKANPGADGQDEGEGEFRPDLEEVGPGDVVLDDLMGD